MLKIHILYNFKDGPWGGGNQFLKVLRENLRAMAVYAEEAEKADVILFNSYPFGNEQCLSQLSRWCRENKVVVHRIDGPVSSVRGKDYAVDKAIFLINKLFASGTIFQSRWSQGENKKLGYKNTVPEKVIINAAAEIFDDYRDSHDSTLRESGKINLVAVSWSNNPRKGFEYYRYLDEHLDFGKYAMTFVGNSPFKFKNIKMVGALNSSDLAALLAQHDIFITASENDTCSNALIEAMRVGLPAVGLASGGNPEVIAGAGLLFKDREEMLDAIKQVASDIHFYTSQINLPSAVAVAKDYYDFCCTVANREGTPSRAWSLSRIGNLFLLILQILRIKLRLG